MQTSADDSDTMEHGGACISGGNTLSDEADRYRKLMNKAARTRRGSDEDLRTTPLLSLAVKRRVDKDASHHGNLASVPAREATFPEYALLGFHSGQFDAIGRDEPILMNVNAPSSAFICGSQGSGKSYTLSCMMENCLLADERIGNVTSPVAGVAFHYDPDTTMTVAETAYLCSMGLRVNVLVSQSNERNLRAAYGRLPQAERHLTITPLLLRSSDLSVDRMHRLMAFSEKDNAVPLYMSVALRILRQMATETKGVGFNYEAFKRALGKENLSREQLAPLYLRLDLLESFLDLEKQSPGNRSKSPFDLEAGTLTIVDLSDPFMDSNTACVLFDICLGLFLERRPSCGLAVALDEAHKFMTSSLAASNFTDRLLRTVREQRHNATRVLIATQEPTISSRLLDLCSVAIIHRFTSPAWYRAIQEHLGAASKFHPSRRNDDATLDQIMDLSVGESLVFAPSAFLCLTDAGFCNKIGSAAFIMRTRIRMGEDGGASVLASSHRDDTEQQQRGRERHATWHTNGSPTDEMISMPREVTSSPAQDLPRPHMLDAMEVSTSAAGDEPLIKHAAFCLVLICCACQKTIVLPFDKSGLPNLIEVPQENLKTAVAYATCVQCQMEQAAQKKSALKQFDFAQGNKFRGGEIIVDAAFRDRLVAAMHKIRGANCAVLTRGSRPTYLFLRVVHRAMENEDWIRIMTLGRDPASAERSAFTEHIDGTFFKSSLRPNKTVG